MLLKANVSIEDELQLGDLKTKVIFSTLFYSVANPGNAVMR